MGRIVSGLVTLAIVGAGAFFYFDRADRDDSGEITDAGSVQAAELRVGDCLDKLDELGDEVTDTDAAPCDEPHDGEVYTKIDVGSGDYPGEAELQAKGDRGCRSRLRRQADEDYRGGYTFLLPNEDGWEEDKTNSLICIAVYAEPMTGVVAADKDGA